MKFLVLLLSVLFVVKVSASEEEFAIWSSADITTAEISGIGKFRIFGSSAESVFRAVKGEDTEG
jgi:hypothetical protein